MLRKSSRYSKAPGIAWLYSLGWRRTGSHRGGRGMSATTARIATNGRYRIGFLATAMYLQNRLLLHTVVVPSSCCPAIQLGLQPGQILLRCLKVVEDMVNARTS